LSAEITSITIKENEQKIMEMYNDYVIKNKLKGIRGIKPITKLTFLLENILYITLGKGEESKVKNEKNKRISIYKYKIQPLKIKKSKDCITTDIIYSIFIKTKRSYKEYTHWFA
jgi:hypothetical protein